MRRPLVPIALLTIILAVLPLTSSLCVLNCERAAASTGSCHRAAGAAGSPMHGPAHAPACAHDRQPVRAISGGVRTLSARPALGGGLGLSSASLTTAIGRWSPRAPSGTPSLGSPPGSHRLALRI
jgi:hypothetical protein